MRPCGGNSRRRGAYVFTVTVLLFLEIRRVLTVYFAFCSTCCIPGLPAVFFIRRLPQ